MKTLTVYDFPLGPLPTNSFVVVNKLDKKAIVVDLPPDGAAAISSYLESNCLDLEAIFITHGHWDHYAEAQILKDKYKVPVYAHKDDKFLLENPILMKPFTPWGLKIHALTVDKWVEDGDILSIWGTDILALHAPGHAPGSLVYFFKEYNFAFVGDVIFNGSIGRTDLIGANYNQLIESIKNKIYTLPDNTILYTGHGAATSVKVEKQSNPFVRG